MVKQEEAIKKRAKERDEMLSIAKPFLLDGCDNPMESETFMTLLSRVDKPEKERKLIGNIILDLMELAYKKGGLNSSKG